MKKVLVTVILFLSACGGTPSTDEPMPLDVYPTQLPTPTLAVVTSPITDQEDAFHFFYEIKNMMALGEYEHLAEEIRYPITVNVDGRQRTFVYVANLKPFLRLSSVKKIFSDSSRQTNQS